MEHESEPRGFEARMDEVKSVATAAKVYLGAANLNPLQLLKLQRCLAETQQVVAAVQERIQAAKDGIALELPGVQRCDIQGSCFVVKVVVLKCGQHPDSDP